MREAIFIFVECFSPKLELDSLPMNAPESFEPFLLLDGDKK